MKDFFKSFIKYLTDGAITKNSLRKLLKNPRRYFWENPNGNLKGIHIELFGELSNVVIGETFRRKLESISKEILGRISDEFLGNFDNVFWGKSVMEYL